MDNIVMFGDSYTAGRLPRSQTDGALREALGVPLYNDFSLSGSTAQQWASDFGDRLSSVVSSSADIAVGSLGGNDALAAIADGAVSESEKILALASLFFVLTRLRRKRVILMLYPDPFQGARPESAAGVRALNGAIASIASLAGRAGGGAVELLDLSRVLGPQHFDGSDIHPDLAGYAAMARAVRAACAKPEPPPPAAGGAL